MCTFMSADAIWTRVKTPSPLEFIHIQIAAGSAEWPTPSATSSSSSSSDHCAISSTLCLRSNYSAAHARTFGRRKHINY